MQSKSAFAPGVYLNPVKGTLDFLPCFPNWELSAIRNFVREKPANRSLPCEVHSGTQIVNGIPNDHGQSVQAISKFRDFVLKRLTAVWAMLDCHTATVFERVNGGLHVRDMLLGPLDLETGVPMGCRHAEQLSTVSQ
jgi:hypothetical protein